METTDTTENELTMLVGTYTSGTSKGIYSYRFRMVNENLFVYADDLGICLQIKYMKVLSPVEIM